MIKGHTKIELTNVHTGEKKVVEDDNLVTNAVKYLVNNNIYGYLYSGLNIFSSIHPDCDTWFGGLLLFHDTIEEDPDNCLIPTDNQMIGNARVNYASASGVPEFGAYNSEESSYTIENGKITRKFVYDFGTSKANGTISCVALTNVHAGYHGAGNNSGKRENLTVDNYNYDYSYNNGQFSPFSRYNHYDYTQYVYMSNGNRADDNINMLFLDYKTNTMYFIDEKNIYYSSSNKDKHFTTTGKLRLYKAYYPLKYYNPLGYNISNSTFYSNIMIYDYVDIIVPDELKTYDSGISYNYTNFHTTHDGVWFIFWNNSTNSAMCWFISADLKTTKYINVKNTTGSQLSLTAYFDSNSDRNRTFIIYENYLLCYYNYDYANKHVYGINMDDNTDVFEFNILNNNSNSYFYNFIAMNDQLYVATDNMTYAVDIKNKLLKPINSLLRIYINGSGWNKSSILQVCNSDRLMVCTTCGRYFNKFNGVVLNTFLLSTINNLPEPVTKTNDMTMKITYTLTSDL